MELIGTPRSHFTRKVRLLLDHLGQDYAFTDVGNVAEADAPLVAGNPLMAVPVLRHGDATIIDSDHIAAYIVRQFDPRDRFQVLTQDTDVLNARAYLNGAMAAEVRLVLAERTGLATENALFFDKARATIRNVLDWCEQHADQFNAAKPAYLDFHLISFWDHVHFYGLVTGTWPRLAAITKQMGEAALVRQSGLE